MSASKRQHFVEGIAATYGRRLRRFLALHSPDASDVPDLAQEVFMRLLRVPDHDEIRSPEAYLFTIASHVVHQHSQKRAAMPQSLEISGLFAELQLTSDEDPARLAETQQRLEELQRALDKLPSRVALALVLHRFGGLSVEEIAGQLGVAQITIKKYLARAILHCRGCCGQDAP